MACILAMLFVVTAGISTVVAFDLVNDNFNSEHFSIDVPAGSNFSQGSNMGINFGDVALHMIFFQNLGNNSKDVSAIVYFNDASDNGSVMSDFITDLEKDGKIIEENDNYTVIENGDYDEWNFFGHDFLSGLDDAFSFISGFASDDNVDVGRYMGANVHDDKYVVYLKNSDNDRIIAIAGDDLELLKAMADTASFN